MCKDFEKDGSFKGAQVLLRYNFTAFASSSSLLDIPKFHILCRFVNLSTFVFLAHQNRTITIASDLPVDGAKSPEILQEEWVLGSEIAARNRKSQATFHRTLKSQCSTAFSCLGDR